MSRSFGDHIASQVGVTCHPDFVTHAQSDSDKFVILASDGIWEYVTNQAAVETVAPFWEQRDPAGACDALIAKAVESWQWHGDTVDDITVVTIFLTLP
jgi:serine/threonine protein phosphatase PrpC